MSTLELGNYARRQWDLEEDISLNLLGARDIGAA